MSMIASNVTSFAADFNVHYKTAEWFLNQPTREGIHLKMAFQSLEMCYIRVMHYAEGTQRKELDHQYVICKKYINLFESEPAESKTRNFLFYKNKLTTFLALIAELAIALKLFSAKID